MTTYNMPKKDLTSDNQSSFEMSRKTYIKTIPSTSEKKWYGNRDASDVIRKRKMISVGKGINQDPQSSFTTSMTRNTVNNALRRTRAGGSTVPAKKTQTTHQMF